MKCIRAYEKGRDVRPACATGEKHRTRRDKREDAGHTEPNIAIHHSAVDLSDLPSLAAGLVSL